MTNSYPPWNSTDEVRPSDKKRRAHIEIKAAVLKASASEYVTINHIANRVHLNNALAGKFVKELSKKGLAESKKAGGLTRYSATAKGLAWLKHFESLVSD